MKVSDLPTGIFSVTFLLRNGERTRVLGKVIEKKGIKHFINKQSPKKSFGPGTRVIRKREVRAMR